MAVIGKIRNRLGGLLVVLVGGALLLFVVSDFFDSRQGMSQGTRSIGTIAGDDVDLSSYERRVTSEIEALRNDFNQPVDKNSEEQIRNSVWNEIVKERILKTQVEKAGFGSIITQEEYDDIRFGENIQSDFKGQPQFQKPDGSPDPEKIHQWFLNIENGSPTYSGIQRLRMVDTRLYTKYNTLVKKSLFVNSAQAKDEFEQKNTKATFDFIVKAFSSENDSLYPVDDDDLRRYYNAHKGEKKYKQEASRSFDYVSFPVLPTEDDKQAIRKELTALVAGFGSAPNDSLFCVINSESRSYAVTPYQDGSLDANTDSLILHADTGMVVGPYQDAGFFKLAKVRELAAIPEVRIRHILFSSKDAKRMDLPEAEVKIKKARADSVLAELKRDRKKFDDLNNKFTEDPGGKSNNGDYGFFGKDKDFVQDFKDAGFKNPVGWIGVVKTEFGYHVIEVMEKRERKERRICTVDRKIIPSPKTFSAIYKKANEFSLDNSTAEAFKSGADTFGLEVKPVDNQLLTQKQVAGVQEPTALLGWVNSSDQETGKVSGPLLCGEQYLVALLRAVKEEGEPALEGVREAFTREAVKKKKAQAYRTLMDGKTDLAEAATALGLQVQTATDMLYNSFSIPGGNSENEVIGRLFALPAGTTAGPFTGDNGVYLVRMNSMTPAGESADLSTEKKSLADRRSGNAEYMMLNALRTAADVKDDRAKYYQ